VLDQTRKEANEKYNQWEVLGKKDQEQELKVEHGNGWC